jgi:hypothetical protein
MALCIYFSFHLPVYQSLVMAIDIGPKNQRQPPQLAHPTTFDLKSIDNDQDLT